jgi:hypothetical protein
VDVDVLRSLSSHNVRMTQQQFMMYRGALHRMLTAVIALYSYISMSEEDIETSVMRVMMASKDGSEPESCSPADEAMQSYAEL